MAYDVSIDDDAGHSLHMTFWNPPAVDGAFWRPTPTAGWIAAMTGLLSG